jgi:glycosyltransferase involved in cell wall biosynthesis
MTTTLAHPALPPLRVALLAGTLGRGGAEKQFTYMARTLAEHGVQVRVFSLTTGEFYQSVLEAAGLPVTFLGGASSRVARMAALVARIGAGRPHIVQSGHAHTNLYATAAALACGAVSIGAWRSGSFERWADYNDQSWMPERQLRAPTAVIINSEFAARDFIAHGILSRPRAQVIPNVIDLDRFDARAAQPPDALPGGLSPEQVFPAGRVRVAFVGSLLPIKRVEYLIAAFAHAYARQPALQLVIIGDGPERARLLAQAAAALPDDAFTFLGARDDVPALLAHMHIFALTSGSEGSPNVVLEAMAARLPVVTVPAGDAGEMVSAAEAGIVADDHDWPAFGAHLAALAADPAAREAAGASGRAWVTSRHAYRALAGRLFAAYEAAAGLAGKARMGQRLAQWRAAEPG